MKGLGELIRTTTGLDPAALGRGQIERAIRRRMEQTRETSLDGYCVLLRSQSAELQALIELITVPETWFFRDPAAFTAIVERARAHTSPLPFRVLSLPCSTGEEPYSAAIALLDGGVGPDRFRIDACDICEKSVAEAKRGLYGRNSFRTGDLGLRQRHFEKKPDGVQISEAVRAQVSFRLGNLLRPAGAKLEGRYEAILCRNLLIYFDASTQQEAVAILHRLLAPDGVLCVAPAEAALLLRPEFTALPYTGVFSPCQEKRGSAAPTTPGPAPRRKTMPASRAATSPPAISTSTKPAEPGAGLTEAVHFARAGRYAEAAAICTGLASSGQASAEVYYLLAVVSEADGKLQEAASHYRKAVYLDPKHAEALLHFSLLTAKMGDLKAAEKLRERALRITHPAPARGAAAP